MDDTTSTADRRRRGPFLVVGGAAALAVAGVAVLGAGTDASAEEEQTRGPKMEHAQQRMERAEHRRSMADGMDQQAHMEALAELTGVDAEELAAVMEELRAGLEVDREAMRDSVQGLEPEDRRAAMLAFAAERQAAMSAALEALGVDPAVLAEHRAEHRAERSPGHESRGPRQMQRGGPGAGPGAGTGAGHGAGA
jgi:hypothetical protein